MIGRTNVGGGAGLNFKVVGGTSAPTSPKENTIWVNTDVEITDWVFSATDPSANKLDLLKGAKTFNEYCTSDGNITIDNDSEYKLSDYIDVQYGKTYMWNYNISNVVSANHYIVEFTSDNVFKTKIKTVASVSGTSFNGTYTPSSSDVVSVRIGWGIFAGATVEVSFDDYSIPEGMVWILTGTSSAAEFNALKKNSIQVCPLSAKQYVDGAWVNVTAQSYIDGAWADWILYLYQKGNTCDSLTGGYDLYYATLTADHIYVEIHGASQGRACTKNKIDITNVTTLYLEIYDLNADDDDAYFYFIVTSNNTAGVTDTTGDIVRQQYRAPGTLSNATKTLSVDVSQVTGEYYVKFGGYSKASGTSGDFKVREIRGEP